ncbi:MAG: MFS transporter [Omnitrophica WOR_2 bacterium]
MTGSTNALPITRTNRSAAWKVALPAGIAMALSLFGDLTLYAVLPVYAARLAISLEMVGVLLSANRLVRIASNPVVGFLMDRLSRRKLVLVGLLTGIVPTIIYITGQGFWPFLAGRLIWGISWSLIYIGAYCMILDASGQQEYGRGSGTLQAFYFAGLAASPLFGGLLTDLFGFHQALFACAIVQGTGFIVALVFLPETRPVLAQIVSRRAMQISLVKTCLKIPGWVAAAYRRLSSGWTGRNLELILANTIYMATLFTGDGILMSTLSLLLKQRYGETIPLVGLVLPVAAAGGGLLAIRAAVSGCTAPVAGRWSDRSGNRWLLTGWGALAAAAGCSLIALIASPWLILGGVILAALGSGVILTLLPAITAAAMTGERKGLAMGILINSGDIGSAIAPLAGYLFLSRLTLPVIYLASGGLLAAGFLGAIWQAHKSHSSD